MLAGAAGDGTSFSASWFPLRATKGNGFVRLTCDKLRVPFEKTRENRMIGYVTVGVSDIEKAKAFYCDLFADRGAKVIIDAGRIAMIGATPKEAMISVCEPYDKNDPQPGNGNMVAFAAKSKEEVDALYAKAISLGARCEGAPGQRIPDRFYGAYVRDLDGNKIAFYLFG